MMSDIVVTKYSELRRAANALADAHDDVARSVDAHADMHAARLDAMRAKLREDHGIADGIARHHKTV